PSVPPSTKPDLQSPTRQNNGIADPNAPVCPDGQIPVPSAQPLNIGPANGVQKGNPLLRSQTRSQMPQGMPATKFLHFNDVYRAGRKVQSSNPSKLQNETKKLRCIFQENSCYYYASAGLRTSVDGGGMILSVNTPAYENEDAQGHTLNEISVHGG